MAKFVRYEGKVYKARAFVENKINNWVSQLETNRDADNIRFFVIAQGEGFYPLAVIDEKAHYLGMFLAGQGCYVTN